MKEIRVEHLNGGIGVLFLDDEAEIDIRSSVRNHQDIDIRNTGKSAAGDAGRVFKVISDKADEGHVCSDFNVPEGLEVFNDGVE